MEKIILYRNNNQVSPFASSFYELLKVKGDTLILGYGYMRKSIFDKKFKREDENDTEEDIYIRKWKTYTREKFKKCILRGFENAENPTIKLIGCINENNYKKEFVNFGFELEKLLDNEDINIEIYITKDKDFQNKIATKLDKENIKIMITGNSNITTTTLWHENNNSNNNNIDIDVMYYDKNSLKEDPEILESINNINKLICKNNKYLNKIIEYKLSSENGISLISKNSYITSPFEAYAIKDKIFEGLSNNQFNYIYAKKYKIDILATIYSYYMHFYKNRTENCDDDYSKYYNLKKYYNEYNKAIKGKDICCILQLVDEIRELGTLEFETAKGNIKFKDLILKILISNKDDIKSLFIRDKYKGFINYYNERYEDKL